LAAAVILVSFLFSGWAQLYAKGKEKSTLEKALSMVTKDVLGDFWRRRRKIVSPSTFGRRTSRMATSKKFVSVTPRLS